MDTAESPEGQTTWSALVEEGLAQRIDAIATWDNLAVDDESITTLREIPEHVRRHAGATALFVGRSGTGKTMAAQVLANELDRRLYRIDLSAVVSKYIGETERSLARLFDAAERGSAVLLFDGADALFGKRTEVKDSHDRYANIEVNYLVHRLAAHRGLLILATSKSALDPAFQRRLRFVVKFRNRRGVSARR